MRPLILPALLVLCAGCTPSDAARAKEPEAVYESLLGERCCAEHVILQQVTDTTGLSGPKAFKGDDEEMAFFSRPVQEAVKDLRARSASVYPLPDSARISFRDQRVSADSAHALLEWIRRDKVDRLPGRASLFFVSAVGFSRDGDLAVVQIVEVCGLLCGGANLRAVRRHPGGWIVAEELWNVVF